MATEDTKLPRLINSHEDLARNLETLEGIRSRPASEEYSEYIGYVQRGTCFIPYATADGIAFAPSRLVGYADNDFERQRLNLEKHGSKTNAAISKIYNHQPYKDSRLETEYREFCRRLGIEAPSSGSFGNDRKFWNPLSDWAVRKPLGEAPVRGLFSVGTAYTRAEIADLIGLSDEDRKGDWTTGYTFKNSEFFIFANIGVSGRTGHDYANRWEGKHLIWFGKRGSRLGQPQIDKLLSGDFHVHVFWRTKDRSSFMYAGLAVPLETWNNSPVEIKWAFENPKRGSNDRLPSTPSWRRGPPPCIGTRSSERTDGPTKVYILSFEGATKEIIPNLSDNEKLIKFGMSNDVGRRIRELSSGIPSICNIGWKCLATRDFPDSVSAYQYESAVLENARSNGTWVEGEFAKVTDEQLAQITDNGWETVYN